MLRQSWKKASFKLVVCSSRLYYKLLIKIPIDFELRILIQTHCEPFEVDSLLIFSHFKVRLPIDTDQHNLNVDKWNRKFKIAELL